MSTPDEIAAKIVREWSPGSNFPILIECIAAALTAEREKAEALLTLYREAVRVDVTMEGPRWCGVNASALKRAWEADHGR